MKSVAAVLTAAALSLLLIGGLSACKKRSPEKIPKALASTTTVEPPDPGLRFARVTPDAIVELTLPPQILAYPDVKKRLYDDGKRELSDFLLQAHDDRARFAKKGVAQAAPYERRIAWTLTAVTPRLISLRSAWYDYTGGAHPDHGSGAFLWDRQCALPLLKSELFKPDVDFTALNAVLCDEITKIKLARVGPTDPHTWSCPRWSDSHAVLVPSTQPWRAGGMMFLFDPYLIGPYAEGDYEALIPQAAFRSVLSPAWAADFAGAPAASVQPQAQRPRL